MKTEIDKSKHTRSIIEAAKLTKRLCRVIHRVLNDGGILPAKVVSMYNKSLLRYWRRVAKYNKLFGTSINPPVHLVATHCRLDRLSFVKNANARVWACA